MRLVAATLAFTPLALSPLRSQAPQRDNKPSESGAMPPKTWVDKDTGHRVWRVSDEPNSGAFYFNVNAFTPDHKSMVYNSPEGIRVLDLATMTTPMLVPNSPPPAAASGDAAAGGRGGRGFGGGTRAIVVGYKTDSVFFTRMDPETRTSGLYKADTNTGAITKLVDLPAASASPPSTPMRRLPPAPITNPTCPAAIPTLPTPSSLPRAADSAGAALAVRARQPLPARKPHPARRSQLRTPMQRTRPWAAPTCNPTTRAQ